MQNPPAAALPPRRRRLRVPAVLVACLLGLAAWTMQALVSRLPSGAQQGPASEAGVVPLSAPRVREVAPVGALPEAVSATAPPMVEATGVAAAPPAVLSKEDALVMKQSKPSVSTLKKVGRTAMGVAGACLELSCSSASPQVLPPPPKPEACPQDALKTMKKLGIRLGYERAVILNVIRGEPHVISVNAGEAQVRLGEGWEGLRSASVVSGQLILGNRVYGRFTSAVTHDRRATYPVCMELIGLDGKRGLERKPGSDADSARVFPLGQLKPVDHFE
jgi:serine/threonine-protein kinase